MPASVPGERRITACCDDEMHLGRKVLHEMRQGTVNGCGSNDVIVIEYEHEILPLPAEEVLGEQRQYDLVPQAVGD